MVVGRLDREAVFAGHPADRYPAAVTLDVEIAFMQDSNIEQTLSGSGNEQQDVTC